MAAYKSNLSSPMWKTKSCRRCPTHRSTSRQRARRHKRRKNAQSGPLEIRWRWAWTVCEISCRKSLSMLMSRRRSLGGGGGGGFLKEWDPPPPAVGPSLWGGLAPPPPPPRRIYCPLLSPPFPGRAHTPKPGNYLLARAEAAYLTPHLRCTWNWRRRTFAFVMLQIVSLKHSFAR